MQNRSGSPQLINGRPEAAAAIWNWRSREPPDAAVVPTGPARKRGALQALVGATAGALMLFFGARVLAGIIFTIASVTLVAAIVSPTGLYAGIERAFKALGHRVGLALTWLLMGILFYLLFLPFGLLFRRGTKDPMRRFYEAGTTTYWEGRTRGRSASGSRIRQY